MNSKPSEIARDVVADRNIYPLTKNSEEIDYPFIRQVLAIYFLEQRGYLVRE